MALVTDPGLRLNAYTAEAGSPDQDALNLLASWTATRPDTPQAKRWAGLQLGQRLQVHRAEKLLLVGGLEVVLEFAVDGDLDGDVVCREGPVGVVRVRSEEEGIPLDPAVRLAEARNGVVLGVG